MPEPEAAAIFMPFHLAWLALYERARIQAGETLLVHAGAGGAGSAALQLGVHAGARVFATAGSAEKTKLCRDLGAELAINYRETDFVEAVLDATDGRGVDVAFDAVSGDVTLQTFRCMAFNGRHILAGFASGIEQEDEGLIPRPVLFGNFSLVGVCHAYVDDPGRVQAAERIQLPVAPRRRATARRAAGAVRGGQAARDRRPGGAVLRPARRARRDGATPDRRPHRDPAVRSERQRAGVGRSQRWCSSSPTMMMRRSTPSCSVRITIVSRAATSRSRSAPHQLHLYGPRQDACESDPVSRPRGCTESMV